MIRIRGPREWVWLLMAAPGGHPEASPAGNGVAAPDLRGNPQELPGSLDL